MTVHSSGTFVRNSCPKTLKEEMLFVCLFVFVSKGTYRKTLRVLLTAGSIDHQVDESTLFFFLLDVLEKALL